MKKGAVILLVLLIAAAFAAITFLPFASAVNVKCSNETKILSDIDEIIIGDKSNINGLGIAVIDADETNAIGRLTADLLVDAGKASVSNKSYSQEISLSDGTHTINFANATEEKAVISIDGTYMELYKGDVNISGTLFVMISSIDISDSENPGAKIVIGSQKLSLSNTENPAEKVGAEGIDYVVELYSASDSGATIKVSKCEGGDISFGAEDAMPESAENISSSASETNTSATNESAIINETAVTNANGTNQSSNAASETGKNPNIFVRMWRWFKGIFS